MPSSRDCTVNLSLAKTVMQSEVTYIVEDPRDVQAEEAANALLSLGGMDFLGQRVQRMLGRGAFAGLEMVSGQQLVFLNCVEHSSRDD